jgi:hypothetical protein
VQSILRLLSATSVVVVAGSAGAAGTVVWLAAPDYVRLVAPANQRHSYAVSVTAAPLDEVLAQVAADAEAVAAPGAWQAGEQSPLEAFGTAGPYNRWLLARLYGSRRPRVARGARTDRGRVVESWTLVSPYPSADLRTLHPGTMRLILRISPPQDGPDDQTP